MSRAALKNFCAELIGHLIDEVTVDDSFERELADDTQRRIAVLKAMAWEWMIEDPSQETVRYGQRRLVEALFDGFWDNPRMLPNRQDWLEVEAKTAPDENDLWPAKARLVCDHVAGMTDLYALHVHAEMFGGGGAPNLRLL